MEKEFLKKRMAFLIMVVGKMVNQMEMG